MDWFGLRVHQVDNVMVQRSKKSQVDELSFLVDIRI